MMSQLGTFRLIGTLAVWWLAMGLVRAEGLNARLAEDLKGQVLKEERIVLGMAIPLNSIIVGPSYERSDPSDPLTVITFQRSDLTREFIVRFFDEQNRDIRVVHPFAARGIEAVLAGDQLFVIIHRGVVLHLRADVRQFPGFRTFRTDDAVGIVTLVTGEFAVSRDQATIQERLGHLWTEAFGPMVRCNAGTRCVRMPDGSYAWPIDPAEFPPYFPPRVAQ